MEWLLVLLPLLMAAVAMIFMIVTPFVVYLVVRHAPGISLGENEGPVNVGYEERVESSAAFQHACANWLEQQTDAVRAGYERAERWCAQNSPWPARDTEITATQQQGIQEKGVSAWTFESLDDTSHNVFVSARTELQFLADSTGMAQHEGGACTIQSNLPLPKVNDVYYFEVKMFSKPSTTNVAVGLATKPYPSFRFPGYARHSVGYFSEDGSKCFHHPIHAVSYGPAYVQGDTIGVGYRPRTGSLFFTRNGVRLPEAFTGLQHHTLFPTLAADGETELHVNFGQAGFVFIEANVKKWGLAPMVGTLAPPPAYGQDKDSILLAASGAGPSTPTPGGRAIAADLPPYDADPPPSESHSFPTMADGIHMTSLAERVTPPPYVDATPASPPPPPMPAPPVASRRAPVPSRRGWFSGWRRAQRDTSSGRQEAPLTELHSVIIE